MAKHEATTTQSAHPWKAVLRTAFAAIVALAALASPIYEAIAQADAASATGWAAAALGIAGAITRVLALPAVESFLRTFLPFLAAGSNNDE